MIRQTAKLVLLAGLISGCTGEVWRVDARFSQEEQDAITEGAEVWNRVGQSILVAHGHRVTGQETTGRYIVRATERTVRMFDDEMSPIAVGKDSRAVGRETIVLVPERMKNTPLWQVVAHEFGHSLDVPHVDDPRAIMYHTSSPESLRCLTGVDIAAMCEARGCDEVPRGCDE